MFFPKPLEVIELIFVKARLIQAQSCVFRVNWLLVCFCIIPIIGCSAKAIPETQNLIFDEDATLPNLTLSRYVVLEVGTAKRIFYGESDYVQVESESRFGDPDEEPNFSCIYAGLREALPSIDIIPTATFWEQIGGSQNVIELPELFTDPESSGLRALQADVLILAYHARIDVEYDMVENVYAGGYSDLDRETAAVVVVDLNRKTIIHGSTISFEDQDDFFHIFIIPFGLFTLSPSDICITVAEQAGHVIASKMPDRTIRALVVVAGEEIIEIIRQAAENEKREAEEVKKAAEFAPERAKLELEANKGNTDAQLKLFKGIRASNPTEALRWLCYSADLGNQEARKILAEIYEYGGYIWIKEGIIERNYILAYVWRGLSGQYYPGHQQFYFVSTGQYLTTAELSEAKKMLEDWQPGNCERELGLVGG